MICWSSYSMKSLIKLELKTLISRISSLSFAPEFGFDSGLTLFNDDRQSFHSFFYRVRHFIGDRYEFQYSPEPLLQEFKLHVLRSADEEEVNLHLVSLA